MVFVPLHISSTSDKRQVKEPSTATARKVEYFMVFCKKTLNKCFIPCIKNKAVNTINVTFVQRIMGRLGAILYRIA